MDRVLDPSLFTVFRLDGVPAGIGAWEQRSVNNWLRKLKASQSSKFIVDTGGKLWSDYSACDDGDNPVWETLRDLGNPVFVQVTVVPSGARGPSLAPAWRHLGRSQRWVLAVAQIAPWSTYITNATCTDWHPSKLPSDVQRPEIEQVLPDWLNRQIPPPALAVVSPHHPASRQLTGALAAARPAGIGTNGRRAWEDAARRYEWDYQHGCVEVYRLTDGVWLHEADSSGTVTKTTGGAGRTWGKP